MTACPNCHASMTPEGLARHQAKTQPCAGTSKTNRPGEPCAKCVTKPATVCFKHGGAAPQVRAAVERRREQEAASAMATRAVKDFGGRVDIHPFDSMLQVVGSRAAMRIWLQQKIASFESDADLKQLSVGAERFERPSVWVEMLDTALREELKASKACMDVGIDERRLQLQKSYGDQLVAVMNAMVDGMGRALVLRGVSAETLADFQREDLAGIARAAILAVIPPEQLGGAA